MTARTLQRVVVRMLHDPSFRAAVYADPVAALSGLDLTPENHRLLLASDARAWGVDVQRADRVLHAMLAEFPVSALVLLEDGLVFARLSRFFQSAFFHDAIMVRRSLARAFGDYLATLTMRARARSLIALEQAIATIRRARRSASATPANHLQRSPLVRPVALAAGTLAAWHKAKQALGDEPLATLIARKRPRVGSSDERSSEWVLLELKPEAVGSAPAEPSAAFIGEALGHLLLAAEEPVARAFLEAIAEREGADANEAREIIDELVAEGLLV